MGKGLARNRKVGDRVGVGPSFCTPTRPYPVTRLPIGSGYF